MELFEAAQAVAVASSRYLAACDAYDALFDAEGDPIAPAAVCDAARRAESDASEALRDAAAAHSRLLYRG
jgi:hypothetical protein